MRFRIEVRHQVGYVALNPSLIEYQMPGLCLIKAVRYNAVNFSHGSSVDVAEADTGDQPPQTKRITFVAQDDTAVAIRCVFRLIVQIMLARRSVWQHHWKAPAHKVSAAEYPRYFYSGSGRNLPDHLPMLPPRMRIVTKSYVKVACPTILERARILFCKKSSREHCISVCGIRYGRTVQGRRCITDFVLLLSKRCQCESAPTVNPGSVSLETIMEGWAAICKAHLHGCTHKVRHIVAAYEPCRVPNAASVDIVGDQKQPGIFEATGCQHVETGMDEEFAPWLSRGPDVVDRSSGGFYLNVQSVASHENPQKRGLPELGRITFREVCRRAPALKT